VVKLRLWAGLASTLGLVCSREALAVEVEDVAGEPLTVDVTNTAIANYLFDNRNDSSTTLPPPSTVVDDTFGEFIDHLNLSVYYWRFRLGMRVDLNTYYAQLDDYDLRDIAKERLPPDPGNPFGPSGVDRYDYENAFRRELHTRYKNTIYPSKLFAGYTAPGVDITIGDFYAQLGRGIVLSVRKIDEVGQDTTIRGFKTSFKKSFEDGSLSVTALAGQANPLRVDDQTGRRLHGAGSLLFFGFPEAKDFTYYTFDQSGAAGYVTDKARPSYLEDAIYGLSVEAGPKQVLIGAHSSLIVRKSNSESFVDCQAANGQDCASAFPTFTTLSDSALRDAIISASGSVNVPSIDGHGDAYLEVAVQHATNGRATAKDGDGYVRVKDHTGYGIFLNATLREGPVALTFEGKHYQSLLPLSGNISADLGGNGVSAAPEFGTIAYNQPPNADSFYQEPLGSPNICITGGRLRADYQANTHTGVYSWVGFFNSQTEEDARNIDCETDEPAKVTRTLDAASGTDLAFEKGKTYVKAWIGGRQTFNAAPVESVNKIVPTDQFYREGYIRYDVAKHLAGDFTLQSQGFHRHRYEPTLSASWWNEGENYLALRWAPHFAFIFGFEYLGRPGCSPDVDGGTCFYFSGGAQFKASSSKDNFAEMLFDTVNVFVGQRRGAIRCVSGVCRQFPPFEGAKLELTSRF
jgi:hypothetical protein